MTILYIIYFTTLLFWVFNVLNKSIISTNLKISIIIFLAIFTILQINVLCEGNYMKNEVFYILVLFTVTVFIFHGGISLLILLVTNDENLTKGNYLVKGLKFFRSYFISLVST